MRVGIGYDLHRLAGGRPLILGGVKVPFAEGLAGHSDADVLVHAIIDALLGAAALGDIGRHFPDSDARLRNADSLLLLKETVGMVRNAGFSVVNVDANLIAQAPRLSPHIEGMRANIAACLQIDTGRVSVKAKTNEQAGPEGRGEAMSAQAIVLIE